VKIVDTGAPACFGDGSSGACPCGNQGAIGRGCENSASTGGARLEATGFANLSADSVVLTSAGGMPTANSIFLQGDQNAAPLAFGDGLRCAGGILERLYLKGAVAGVTSAPDVPGGDMSVSARSAFLGDTIAAGTSRIYQVYYRDPSPTFCPAPAGNTWNASSAVVVTWFP